MSAAAAAPPPSWFGRVRAVPCAVLLAAQLLAIVIYPFTENDVGRLIFSVVQLGVLLLAVAAVRMTPAHVQISMALGIPAAALTVVEVFVHDNDAVSLVSGIVHATFYLYLGYGLIRYMFNDNKVTTDEMFATGACFTVVAWGFAYLYDIVQIIWGSGQFTGHPGDLSWMQLLFLSFTTMTNTGLSDISPGGGHARSVVMLEQLSGLYYIALVVARLLGLTMTRFAKQQ